MHLRMDLVHAVVGDALSFWEQFLAIRLAKDFRAFYKKTVRLQDKVLREIFISLSNRTRGDKSVCIYKNSEASLILWRIRFSKCPWIQMHRSMVAALHNSPVFRTF